MKHFCRRFRTKSCLTNAKGISKIKGLQKKPRSEIAQHDALKDSLEIFRNVVEPPNGGIIDALLSSAIRHAQPETIHLIWSDIEHYHQIHHRSKDRLNYSLIIKCLIRSDDHQFNLLKCVTVLKWMEHNINGSQYVLKLHSSLITKLVSKCASSRCLESLHYIHGLIKTGMIASNSSDKFIASALINAYGACKQPISAFDVFQSFRSMATNHVDSVLIGAVMTALINNYHYTKAIEIYESAAESLRNHIIQNLAMKAYTKNNQFTKSLEVYSEMDIMGSVSTKSRDVMLLKTASKGSMIEIADKFRENAIPKDIDTVIHLLNLYGKCGMIEDAERVFTAKSESKDIRDVRLWNAMLRVFGRNNRLNDVLRCYSEMQSDQRLGTSVNVEPDCSTFVIVMNACNHCGDTKRAQRIWNEDIGHFDIKYDEKIISVLIDSMAKEGQMEEAITLLLNIGETSYESAWIALLDGTRRVNDLEMGERVYREIWKRFEMDSIVMSSATTLISHLYTMNGEMGKRKAVRKLMERRGWNNTKRHGKSSVQIEGVIYTFCAGLNYQDGDCTLTMETLKQIGDLLDELCQRLEREYGFEHDVSAVTNRVRNEKERIRHIREHSEKLALCYWLLVRPESKEIMISNSQRICTDCHRFMAAVSRMKQIEITVAEPNLIHVFKNGVCSCERLK